MKQINWGIIGCGEVTEVKSGPAFNRIANSSLVAVMRRDGEKAKDYAFRHNVPRWYDNAEMLINDPEVNAIYIATPPAFHEEYAIRTIQAGKPVYVEKPMSLDVASAIRMQHFVSKHKAKLSVAHYRREHPYFKKIRSLINDGAIGDIRFVHLNLFRNRLTPEAIKLARNAWRVDPAIAGGGLFYDLAPHQLDLLTYFFGDYIEATGFSANQSRLYNAHDYTTGRIIFEKNIVFTGVWSFDSVTNKDECLVMGTKGCLDFSFFGKQEITLTTDNHRETLQFEPPNPIQQPLIEKVAAYFRGEGSNPTPVEDGLKVMELMEIFGTGKNISNPRSV